MKLWIELESHGKKDRQDIKIGLFVNKICRLIIC